MSAGAGPSARRIDEDVALRAIVVGTASETGQAFYRALVWNLANALGTHGAWPSTMVEWFGSSGASLATSMNSRERVALQTCPRSRSMPIHGSVAGGGSLNGRLSFSPGIRPRVP